MKNKPHKTCKTSPPEIGEETYKFIEENAPKKITIEQLRRHKDYENITEDDANNIIESLYKLAVLSYIIYLEQNEDFLDIAA